MRVRNALCTACAVGAAWLAPRSSPAQTPVRFSGAAAVALPVGNLGDAADVGTSLALRGEAKLPWQNWSVRGDVTWDRFSGRGVVDNYSYFGAAANMLHRSTGRLYEFGGAGVYGTRTAFNDQLNRDGSDLGVQTGLGIDLAPGPHAPFVGIRDHGRVHLRRQHRLVSREVRLPLLTRTMQPALRAVRDPDVVRRAREALGFAALAGAYALAGKVSLAAASAHHVVSSIWPPAGIAVFALLKFGPGIWPGVAIGAFVLNVTNGISPAGALIIAAGNTLEGVAAAYLLTRIAHVHRALDRVRDALALIGFAGIVSTVIAATIGVAALAITRSAAWGEAPRLWLVWWTGDAVGVLVVAPLLLTWSEPERDAAESPLPVVEQLFTFLALVAATELLFRAPAVFVFLVFPMATWIALRLGRRAASTAVAAVMVIATWHTVAGNGPFTAFSALGNLFALQLFLAVLAAKSLLFAASRAETRSGRARLLQTESRYRLLARNLPDACIVLCDRDTKLLLAEGPALAAAGFVKEEVEGRTIAELFGAGHAEALATPFRLAFEGRSLEFEFSHHERTYLVRVLPLAERGSYASFAMALAVDITERHESQRELAESRTRLQALSRQLLAAQEDERRRVAREVHDELGQALTGIKISLSALRSRAIRRPSVETDRRLLTVNEAIDSAIDAVRSIVLRLRPGVLDNLGPVAALEWEVQEFTRRSGLPVRLALPAEQIALDAERSTALYRTVQEALTNVLRHADASSVTVRLEIRRGALVLDVTDDGRGIADAELRNPRSMGILGMRERAMSCGGTLEVRRAAGGGTDVVLTVPYGGHGRMVS